MASRLVGFLMLQREQYGLAKTETLRLPGLDELFHDEQEPTLGRVGSLWGSVKIGTLQSRLDTLNMARSGKQFVLSNKTVTNLANEVFGFEGWSTKVILVDVQVTEQDEQGEQGELKESDEKKRYSVSAWAIVRITLKDGTYNEATGSGQSHNLPQKGSAYRLAKMLAVTDAVRRGIMELPLLTVDQS